MLLSIGCKPVKNATSKETTTKRADSVYVKETVIKEVKTAFTHADSVAIQALVPPCPNGKPVNMPEVIKKDGRATVKAQIINGLFTAKCECDTAAIQYENELRLREEFRLSLKASETALKEVKEVQVMYVPLLIKVLAIIGAAAIVFTLIKIFK